MLRNYRGYSPERLFAACLRVVASEGWQIRHTDPATMTVSFAAKGRKTRIGGGIEMSAFVAKRGDDTVRVSVGASPAGLKAIRLFDYGEKDELFGLFFERLRDVLPTVGEPETGTRAVLRRRPRPTRRNRRRGDRRLDMDALRVRPLRHQLARGVSDVESVRRAMRTLAKSERVELAWIQTPGVGGGPMPDWSRQLHARLPLTDEEAEREHAEHKQPDVFDLMPWGAREAFWRSVVGQPAKGGGDG